MNNCYKSSCVEKHIWTFLYAIHSCMQFVPDKFFLSITKSVFMRYLFSPIDRLCLMCYFSKHAYQLSLIAAQQAAMCAAIAASSASSGGN